MAAPVRLGLHGNRIQVRFPYSLADNDTVKDLGGSFNKANSCWTLPLSLANCHKARAAFGDRLLISAPLADWAWAERNRREALEDLRNHDGGSFPGELRALYELAPDLAKAIENRPYQAAGAAFALTGQRVLLGDQPGLGKTYQAIAAIVASRKKRVLVIAPRTAVRSVWEPHLRKLAPNVTPIVAQGSRQERQDAIAEFNARADAFAATNSDHAAALIVNKEMIRVKRMYACGASNGEARSEFPKPPGKRGGCPTPDAHKHTPRHYPEFAELFGQAWDYIVMDESHHALASRYNVQSDNITQIRLGACRLPLADDGLKLAMSGTPYRSKAQKAWGTLNWLDPKAFSSFWRWAEELFSVSEGRYAREVSQKPRDPQEFADQMRPYLIARVKEDVAPELPPITYAGSTPDGSADGPVAVWLDMDPAQAKAYGSMVKMAEAELHGGRITAVGVLAELTRLKQFACSYGELSRDGNPMSPAKMSPALPSNKYDWVLDFLQEREGFGGKVIIASQFTGLLRTFANALYSDMNFKNNHDAAPLMLHGGTTDHGRVTFQRRIQDENDPAWIGFINTRAGGEAITLDRADDMILLDDPWTADEITQVVDRIHRISRIHNVTVYRPRSRGTIEQWIAEMTDTQRADLMALRPAGRKLLPSLFK